MPRKLKYPRWHYDSRGRVRGENGKYLPYQLGSDGLPRVGPVHAGGR